MSVDEENNSAEVNVFPNPFSKSTTLRITNGRITNGDLKIFDVFGKTVFQSSINNQQLTIHLDLPDGIYFYKITSENIPLTSGKLVIE